MREDYKRVVIEEVDGGFRIGTEVYKTLSDAIQETDGYYTFVPKARK